MRVSRLLEIRLIFYLFSLSLASEEQFFMFTKKWLEFKILFEVILVELKIFFQIVKKTLIVFKNFIKFGRNS